jgi:hypothetical protein
LAGGGRTAWGGGSGKIVRGAAGRADGATQCCAAASLASAAAGSRSPFARASLPPSQLQTLRLSRGLRVPSGVQLTGKV